MLLAAIVSGPATGAGEDRVTPMPAIRQELARLNLAAQCDDRSESCTVSHTLKDADTTLRVVITHNPHTQTIYLYIDRFIELRDEDGPTRILGARLLSLNREMVTAKFEWDDTANVIRLSTSLNTDSNFDRKAFRSQLKGLLSVAEKLWPELSGFAPSASSSLQ